MLMAVLGHWKALKTESIDLLRNEFLRREGKIIVDDNSPRIIIERKNNRYYARSITMGTRNSRPSLEARIDICRMVKN